MFGDYLRSIDENKSYKHASVARSAYKHLKQIFEHLKQ